MNQPPVYMCPTRPESPPTSLPTASLRVVQSIGFGGPASCIELALAIYVTQDRSNMQRRGHMGQNSERRVTLHTHQQSLLEEVFTHVCWLSGDNSSAPEV